MYSKMGMATPDTIRINLCRVRKWPVFPSPVLAGARDRRPVDGARALPGATLAGGGTRADDCQLPHAAQNSFACGGRAPGRGCPRHQGALLVLLAGPQENRPLATADLDRRPRARRIVGFAIHAGRRPE